MSVRNKLCTIGYINKVIDRPQKIGTHQLSKIRSYVEEIKSIIIETFKQCDIEYKFDDLVSLLNINEQK